MRFLVISACEDARSGATFEPGVEFLPEPDPDQAVRLIKAGCIRQVDDDAPLLPTDGSDGPIVTQLRAEVSSLNDALTASNDRLSEASNTLTTLQTDHNQLADAHTALVGEHDQLGKDYAALTTERDQLLQRVEQLGADAAANGSDEKKPDYEADKLGDKPLGKASKDELLVIAAYEKAEVPQGDRATVADLVKAIQAKRGA